MATYYLINPIRLGTRTYNPGTLIDSTVDDVTALQNAGARLITSSNATVAAAATAAQQIKLRGGTSLEMFAVMVNAADAADEASITVQTRTLRIQEADLTDAVAGEAQVVNIGAALPTGAVVIGHEVKLDTQFTGGGATSCKLDLGASGDVQSMVNQFDVFGATAGGKKYSPGFAHLTAHGTHLTGDYSAAQLVATFTPDGSHTLAGLTAGDLTIKVFYFVPTL